MQCAWDTFKLYEKEDRFSNVVRIRVTMKERVRPEILEESVNKAILRYPYFAVRVRVDEDGRYVLEPNREKVAVLPAGHNPAKAGSERVNGHLLFVEWAGRDINFYISHSLAGGKGLMPWVMTTVWQYVSDRYHVTPDAPAIRKPGSPLLPDECAALTEKDLPEEPPIYTYKSRKPVVMGMDYLNGLYNPFRRRPNYRLLTFRQSDIMTFAKNNDASVASFFMVVMAKAMDRVLPEKHPVIGGEMPHSPVASLGIPNTHCDILSHVHIDYSREELKWDMEKLGTMTRGQVLLQTDPSVSGAELRKRINLYEQMDTMKGLQSRRKYISENSLSTGKDAEHGTFYLSYTGWMDWGEVAEYVESCVPVLEGHLLLEIMSVGDRIFVGFMQLIDEDKYIKAFLDVLGELGIPCTVKGPYRKRLAKHELPGK